MKTTMGLDAVSRAQLPPKIGRYSVLGYLADGGMAEIFLGREHGRPVVIKRILPHLARQGSFVSMFIDEARIGSMVRHPNVVEIYELGQVGTDLFMVMEYLAGESVSGLLRRLTVRDQRLSFALGAYIIAEACAGLHAAHELCDDNGNSFGLVHRDISPSNLFISYEGEVKVLDFGIATAAHRLTKTSTGQVKGKFSYMSPEQCLGEQLDRRSDIFSLGIVLYELTTQRRLFKRANELLVLKGVTEEPIPRPSREIPGYPELLERVVMRALSRDPSRRHRTAYELRNDLLAVIEILGADIMLRAPLAQQMTDLFPERITEKQALLRSVRAGTDVGELPAAEVDENVELPQVEPRATESHVADRPPITSTAVQRSGRGLGLVLLLLLFAGGGGGVYWWWSSQQEKEAVASAREPTADTVHAMPATTPPPATAPATTPATPTAPTVPSITIHIESIPNGAALFVDGKRRGVTPYDLVLDHAQQLALRLELAGHADITQQLQLDHEQHLLIPLPELPRAEPTRHKTPSSKPPPKSNDDPFQRFD